MLLEEDAVAMSEFGIGCDKRPVELRARIPLTDQAEVTDIRGWRSYISGKDINGGLSVEVKLTLLSLRN